MWAAISAVFFMITAGLYVFDTLTRAQYFASLAILTILYAIYDELRKRNGY